MANYQMGMLNRGLPSTAIPRAPLPPTYTQQMAPAPTGLLSMLGVKQNPVIDFLSRSAPALGQGFAGMVGAGDDTRDALTGFTSGFQHGKSAMDEAAIVQQKQAAEQQKVQAEQAKQQQQIAWLQQNAPEYADMVAQGVMTAPDAAKAWLDTKKAAAAPAVNFDDTSGLRKEVYSLPSYKNMAQATPIYASMKETAGRDTRASDLNLVYGLGKIMDPTSVVREGEMVMVKNTASLPDWLLGTINSLNGGQALTPETRKAIMDEAYSRMAAYEQAFNTDLGTYRGISGRYGLNEADIIPQFNPASKWSMNDPAGLR